MAKMRSRTEALVNAYLNNYQNANAAAVSGGRSAQQSAQSRGSAIMNATDKTLPALKDYSADVLNGIIKSADNAQNTAISNFKLAKKQIEAEQKAAEKAAKAAARSSGRSSSKKSGKKSSSTSSTDDASGSNTSLDSLFGGAASTSSGTTGSTARSKPKADDTKKDSEKTKGKSAQEKYLESKKAGARTTAAKSYAEQNGTGRVSTAQPAQSRATGKAGNTIGSTAAAAGQAQSAAETQAAKDKRNDYKSRQEDIAAALKKLQTDADYRTELSNPGRKLTSAEVAAVNQYEKSTKNTGLSGLKRVLDLAKNSDNLSEEEYAKKAAELNAELNQNSALRSKAQANGAGQSAQAFTAGIYDSVPFLSRAVDAMAGTANSIYPEQQQLPMLSDTLDAAKSYDPLAAGAGTMVGKGMQYNLFNTAMAGTPLAETMGKVGGKVASAASKVPVLGRFATPAAGEALGRILTDQTADTALDTIPSLVNDLQTYDDQQSRMKNGKQVDDALTPGQIGLNTLGNVAQNFAFNAIPEVGGAVLNRLKVTAGNAAQDALKQADDAVQNAVPKAIIENNTADAYHQNDILSSAYADDVFPGMAANEAKQAVQNSGSLPIDAQAAKAYNEVNGGVVNDNLGAGVRADVPGIADSRASNELQPGNLGDGISGQAAEGGQNSTASVLGRGVQGNDAKSAAQVAEWAKSITGKGRQSVYTRRIENLYNQMQNGASREGMAEEAANIAAGLVKESDFAEPLDEATSNLREYMKNTPIRLDEKAAGDILYTSGLKNIQQYNFQNGTKFSLTYGIPYDTAMQDLGEMGVGVNGSSVDDLLKAVDASNAKPLVDSDQAAAYSDYLRDRILDGPSDTQMGAEDFADWLDAQSFDRDAPDYVQRLLERDNLTAIDGVGTARYNVNNIGGAQNGTEINVGRSIEGVEPGGTGTGYPDVQGAWRNADGNQRVFRQPVIDDAQRQAVESTGATWGNIQDTTADPHRFSKALDESIAANKHGLMVSPKSVEELQQPGTITFMGEDGLSGALVTADGDIEAVFKNPASKTKRASTQLLITAVENGGNKLDCYGADLVNAYNRFGFEPVAKVEWNPDYAPDGWTYGPKDVYVMKLQDGVDANNIVQRLGKSEADGGFHTYTTAELDALPTMEYDEALAYRDSLLKAPSADAGGADALRSAASPLNGSESLPAHSVGANKTQYNRAEVLNQDYGVQRAMGGKIDADEAAAAGIGQQTHTVYSRAEGKDTAKQDFNLLVQQNGNILSAGRTVADELTRKSADGNFDASDVYRGYYAADQLQNMLNSYEKGSADAQLVQAQIENLNRAVSAGQSKNAQALSAGRWAQIDEYTPIRKFEQITQRKVNDFAKTRDGKQLESLATDVVEMAKSGPQDEEFTAFLKAQGVDVGDNPLNAQMDDLAMRIKRMADTKGIKATDEQAKSAAASILAGGNADDVFNAMARKSLGIENLSQEDYDYVKNAFAEMADMPDSKARYEKELDAYKRLTKYMPAKTFGDKMESIRYLSMLGNTRTHARNVLGNVSMGVVTRAKDNVSGVMQLALPKDQRTKAVGTTLTADGRKMVDLAKEYGQNKMYSVLYNDGKFNAESGLRAAQDTFTSKPGKVIQKAADINSALLEKEDDIFLSSAFGNAMASQLKARGYDSSVFTATDAKSKQALVDAAATALRDAKEATFHEDNFLSTALKNYQNDIKGHGVGGKILWAVGEGVLPFKKTPLNIAKNAMEYNIVGGTVEAAYRYAAGASSADVIDAAAKGLTGTALMGIGGILAYNGLLNGSKSGDDRADAFDEMTGKQEYSINIPGKGTYTIDWASPASVPLLMGAEIANEWQNGGLSVTKFLDAARKIGNPILDTTMLQGLNDTLDSVSYADSDDKLGTLITGTLNSYAQQYVPTALGQIARTIDPLRRSTYGGGDTKSERDIGYNTRKMENKVPGLSMTNEPYIDQWGREQKSLDGTDDSAGGYALRSIYNMLSPGYLRQENVTPVDEYLQGLYGSTNDSHVLPEKASSKITVDSENYYMTPEEKTEYAKTSGQTAYDIIDSLRQNDLFLKLPEDQQSALVQEAYSVAKTVGGVAAVGDGVSGTGSKAYEAYQQGGVPTLESYLLTKNATYIARDEKRESTGKDTAELNDVETWNTLYNQFGNDAIPQFVDTTDNDSAVRRIEQYAGDSGVSAYMRAYSAVASTLEAGKTPNKYYVGIGMQKYGLDDNDFAKAYLAAYRKTDKKGAEMYEKYGVDGLKGWVEFKAYADADGNGHLKKAEVTDQLNKMSLTEQLYNAYYNAAMGK